MARPAAPSVPLKPCPFCGRQPQFGTRGMGAFIRCDGFRNGCFVAPAVSGDNLDQVAPIWNRRHQEGQADE